MISSPSWYQARFGILAGLLVLIGFGARLSFLLGNIYHVDEFISMLAAVMVAEKGLPYLPSGLFYDSGLLFSLISGMFVALLSFAEEIARWPSVLVGTLTIATYYAAGRRLFISPLSGLMAAGIVAVDALTIQWAGRARMYSLAHFFVLLSLFFLLQNTLHHPNPRGRLLFLLFLAAALLSHTVAALILLPLALTLLIFTVIYNRTWFRYRGLWWEILIAIVILASTMMIFVISQEQFSKAALETSNISSASPLGLDVLPRFLDPGLEFRRFDDLIYFYLEPDYLRYLPFVVVAIGIGLYRLVRGKIQFADVAVFFLVFFIILVIIEQGALFTSTRQKSRYLFITTLPAYFLVASVGLAQFLHLIEQLTLKIFSHGKRSIWVRALTPLVGLGMLVLLSGGDAWDTANVQGTGNYNTAFEYVRQQLQPGDKIMTTHPSAAYLFAGQSDYYANQVTTRVFADEESDDTLVDRYVGGDFIESVEEYNQVLAQNERIWFVVDDARLYKRLNSFFTQQIFAQMDYIHRSGQIYIFRSKPDPVPVPTEPTLPLDYNFVDMIHLEGYSLDSSDLNPNGIVSLSFFWRPAVETPPVTSMPKIFVQLRNNQNQVVAQADHYFYEGLLTIDEWRTLYGENEWLRDTADLQLPAVLDEGPYKIYVGLYDPNTLERIPLTNDSSGENAAVITFPEAG